MFRGGRGRGGGSRGGGRGPKHGGPRLPMALQKEIYGDAAASRGRGPQMSRKDRRKAEREARRGGRGSGCRGQLEQPGRGQRQMGQQQRRQPAADDAPGSDDDSEGLEPAVAKPAAKKRRTEGPQGRQGGGSSKFVELLPAQLQKAEGHDPEQELQRQLARKLGLKKGDNIGGDDGLDELLADLGGLDDLFSDGEGDLPPASSKQAAKQRQAKLMEREKAKEQQRKRRAEVLDSEEEEEEEEEEEGSEDDEGGWEADLLADSSEGEEEEEEGLSEGGSEPAVAGEDMGELSEEEEGGKDSEYESEEAEGNGQPGGSSNSSGEGEEEGSEGSEEGQEHSDLDLLQSGSGGESEEEEEEAADGSEDGADTGSSSSSDEEKPEAKQQKLKQQQAAAEAPGARYLPPAARRAAAAAAAAAAGGAAAAEEEERLVRRVRGLLNRIAESNLQGLVGQLADLFHEEGRRMVSDAVCAELLAAAAEGPRASERFAAVAAATVAGLAGSVGTAEVVANFLDRMGRRMEEARKADDSLSGHNLAMVAAQLYLTGAMRADLTYSLLHSWRQRLSELDVGMLSALLKTCGLALRAEDPEGMRDFVLALQARAAEAGAAGGLSKRAQVMLELLVDIKNNRKREASAAAALSPAVTKWLKACGARDVAVGGITWDKVLQPDKKGIWWRPEAGDALLQQHGAGASALAAAAAEAAAGAVDAEGGLSAAQLLKLAAAQRMNTDARRAVFCAIMGSTDCVDAFEKLLRLNLKGEQEREVVRVCVDVALQEAGYNPYYSLLLLRLCNAAKGHKITLQYCLWDHIKELPGMEMRRLTNLARLAAAVIAGKALPASALKAADFAAATAGTVPRETLFWRVFFQHLLSGCKSTEDCASLFAKLAAAQPQLSSLRTTLRTFLQRSVGPWLASMAAPGAGGVGKGAGGLTDEQVTVLLRRLRAVERALSSGSSS